MQYIPKSISSIGLYILGCIPILISCQTTDTPNYGYTYYNSTYNYDQCEYYAKIDTAYNDTTLTKNTNHLIIYSVSGTDFIATIIGTQLNTDTGLLSISGTSSAVITANGILTITSTTLTGCITVINVVELNKDLPRSMPIPSYAYQSFPTLPLAPKTALNVLYRDGVQNTVALSSLTGSLLKDIPPDLLRLFTLQNKPLQSVLGSDSVSGWQVYQVSALDGSSGNIDDITNQVTIPIERSMSGVFSYFPDGYYTFISNIDSTYNQFGWYQISLSDGIPLAVIYYPTFSGPSLKDSTQFHSSPQLKIDAYGYGVWGISKYSYFPLIRLDSYEQVVLKAIPVKYTNH